MFPIAPAYLWLIAAAGMLLLEALGISGVGLVFGGLAAFVTGALLEAGIIDADALVLQCAIWLALTVGLAALLYKPLKRWRTDPKSEDRFENITGTTARVGAGGLMLGKPGKVYWSGTLMNAMIAPHSKREAFIEGDIVTVASVRGNQLLVIPADQPLEIAPADAGSRDARQKEPKL